MHCCDKTLDSTLGTLNVQPSFVLETTEGNLYNPALFSGRNPPIWEISQEYLDICKKYPPGSFSSMKGHIFKIWHSVLKHHEEYLPLLGSAHSVEDFEVLTQELAKKVKASLGDIEYEGDLAEQAATTGATAEGEEGTSSTQYYRTIPYWRSQPYVRRLPSEEVAKIWAAKDNRHRMGFLEQQAVKKLVCSSFFPSLLFPL